MISLERETDWITCHLAEDNQNILFLSPSSNRAASSIRMRNLAMQFDNAVTLYPRADRYGRTQGADTIDVTKSNPIYLLAAYRKIQEFNPKIVYFLKPNPYSFLPALFYKLLQGCDLVFDCDEWDPTTLMDNKAGWIKVKTSILLTKLALTFSDKIIISNQNIRNKIPPKFHRKLVYIPNGVDTKLFFPRKQATSEFRIVYVGSLYKPEQIRLILDSAESIKQRIPEAVLVFIGPGRLDELRKSTPDYVTFKGMIPQRDIPDAVADAQVLLAVFSKMESLKYASNLKLFEYMALGKPVVASDVGEIRDILEDGTAGFLLTKNSTEELVDVLLKIIEEPGEAEEKAKKAREIASKKYDWQILSLKLKKIFEEL